MAILDADKEGFLRSRDLPHPDHRPRGPKRRGRGHHVRRQDHPVHVGCHGRDQRRRRELQDAYNEAHGIVPKTIVKSVRDIIEISHAADGKDGKRKQKLSAKEKAALIANLEKEMKEASQAAWSSSTPPSCGTRSSSCAAKRPPTKQSLKEGASHP